jgi:hypothetical protein
VLNYEASIGTTIGAGTSTLMSCQTPSYVAGPNEVATFSLDVTYSPATATVISMAPLFWQNGALLFASNTFVVGSVSAGGWGSLHTQAPITLVDRATYRFLMGIKTDAVGVGIPSLTCRGMVTIFKRP